MLYVASCCPAPTRSCPHLPGGPDAPSTPDREFELPLADYLTFEVLTSAEELMEEVVRQLEVRPGGRARRRSGRG